MVQASGRHSLRLRPFHSAVQRQPATLRDSQADADHQSSESESDTEKLAFDMTSQQTALPPQCWHASPVISETLDWRASFATFSFLIRQCTNLATFLPSFLSKPQRRTPFAGLSPQIANVAYIRGPTASATAGGTRRTVSGCQSVSRN